MKWYEFFTTTGIVALTVFGAYAQHIGRFRFHPWLRPIMMILLGVAFLTSEWMVGEEDCLRELVWGGE